MIMVGTVGTVLGVLEIVLGAQELIRIKGLMKKNKNDFCIEF